MKTKLVAFLIIAVALYLAISSARDDSFIVDEIPHVGAGYSYVIKSDYRLNPEHPPLAKDLAGLALSFLNLNQSSFDTKFWNQDVNGQWDFGRNLIFNSGNNALLITHVAKAPLLLFFILSAIIIFIWTKKLYNSPRAGLLALFLFSLSPTVITHSRFVTTDMAALFGVLLATYFFVRFIENQNKLNFILAFASFGIAQLTKFSAFLLVPFFIITAIVWGCLSVEHDKIRSAVKSVLLTLLVFIFGYLAVVWPWYGLHVRNYPISKQEHDTVELLKTYGNRRIANLVIETSNKPYIRGLGHYGLGLLMVSQRSTGGNTAYFLGEIKNTAWKSYFPFVYLVKEPLAFWLIVLIVIIFSVRQCHLKLANANFRNHFTEFVMLLWLAIYWYSSITSNLNIGVRHLLPTYGFVYILIAGQLVSMADRIKNYELGIKRKFILNSYFLILTSLCGWYLFESIRIYPHYLSYFNQIVGGPANAYKYVVDSNLDWGQDLKRLSDWVKENNIEKINLDYFGWADPGYYLGNRYTWINSERWHSMEDFLRDNPGGGYLAVSATFYMNSREKPETSYAWLDSYKPIKVIGNSIFVWHLFP